MDGQISLGILIEFLKYVPCAVLGTYLTFYFYYQSTLYSKMERNRLRIRAKILADWKNKYGTFDIFLSNVPIADIRLLAISEKGPIKKFRRLQIIYAAICILCLAIAAIVSELLSKEIFVKKHIVEASYIVYVVTLLFIVSSLNLGIKSRYEWNFYSRLSDLNKEINGH